MCFLELKVAFVKYPCVLMMSPKCAAMFVNKVALLCTWSPCT